MKDNTKNSLIATGIGLAAIVGIAFIRNKRQKALQKKVDETQPKPITKYNDEITIKTAMIESINFIDLEKNYKEVVMDEAEMNNWKSLICNTSSEIIRTGIINGSFSGLLKCDIPLSELAKSKTDPSLMRGFVISNGKISQQASFKEIGACELAPSIIFSCLSILTSQYYQNCIWRELRKINEHIRKMECHKINKVLTILERACNTLKEFNSKTVFCEWDYSLAYETCEKIGNILGTYKKNLENNINLKIQSQRSDFKEAEEKKSKLEESDFFVYFDIVMWAELLNYMATIILTKIAMSLNKIEDVRNFSNRVKLCLWNDYVSTFNKVKHDVLKYLELEAERSFISKNKINKLKHECETMFQQTERHLNNTYSVVSQPMTNYLYIDVNGKIRKYVKK